jgi:hypothetical protein
MAALAAHDSAQPLRTPRAIALFAARVLAWAVPLFAAWYLAAAPLSTAAGWIAARFVEGAAPVERARVHYEDHRLVFSAEPDGATVWRDRLPAGIVFDVSANPMQFTCSIPFFLALLLATTPRPAWRRAAVAVGVLLALAAAGLYFDVHLQLARLSAPGGGPVFLTPSFGREALALGFQLTTLLVPVLGPVALWMAGEGKRLVSP